MPGLTASSGWFGRWVIPLLLMIAIAVVVYAWITREMLWWVATVILTVLVVTLVERLTSTQHRWTKVS
jgi:nitrate/nitrite transporter NarK